MHEEDEEYKPTMIIPGNPDPRRVFPETLNHSSDVFEQLENDDFVDSIIPFLDGFKDSESLSHYGVKGMRWGNRKSVDFSSSSGGKIDDAGSSSGGLENDLENRVRLPFLDGFRPWKEKEFEEKEAEREKERENRSLGEKMKDSLLDRETLLSKMLRFMRSDRWIY